MINFYLSSIDQLLPFLSGFFIFVVVASSYSLLLLLANLETFNLTPVVQELGSEKYIGVLKEPFLETNNDELRVLKKLLDHEADVLSVRHVKG